MNKEKYVFAQLVEFLNNDKFRYLVRKYDGDKYIKHFTCWNQLLVMMFGQLANRVSLRDVVLSLTAHKEKCYHLGVGHRITKSNIAKANTNRDYRIFEDYAYYLVAEAQRKRAIDIFRLGGKVYAFDSTTIDLCLSVFWWAKFRSAKGGIKIHTLYDVETLIPTLFHITEASVNDVNAMDVITYETGAYYIFDRGYNDFGRLYKIALIDAYFVIRAKKNVKYTTVSWKRRLPESILSDRIIVFANSDSQKEYPEPLRMVKFWDSEQKREFTYLTNATHIDSTQVANLYKNRWQVELFFKWLKQHLKIKRFWGESENAVRIQIYSAMITYCLVAIVQHDMQFEYSIYETLQILSISLTDKANLRDLFDKTKFQNDKEHTGYCEPNLFNF
ncbi:MAG: IS4 family transposase [Rikenellaceae bacterium]